MKAWAKQTFSPLGNKVFRPIWLGSAASNLGGMIQTTAAAWYMLLLTDSPFMVALVQSAAALPLMLFALLAGAVADLFDKRVQMIVALSFCAATSFVLVVLTYMNLVSPPALLVLTFLIGAGTAFYMPAWQSSVLEIVSPEQLSQAVSLNSLNFNVARSVGPSLGAEILALAGAAAAFLANAASYVALIVGLLMWRRPVKGRPLPRESLGRAMTDGLRFVLLSPTVRKIMFRGLLFAFGGAGLMSLPPIIAQAVGGGPRALGLLLGGFGVGAMLGALLAAQLRLNMTAERLMRAATMGVVITLVALAYSQWLWVSALSIALAGVCWVLAMSTLNVSVQTSCPRWVSGRALSIFMMTFSLGIAGGAAVSGVVTGNAGLSQALLLAAAFLASTLIVGRFLPIEEGKLESLEPSRRPKQLAAADIEPQAGPVVVTADYRVPLANAQQFMAVMHALARVRRRDGARRWSLTQDIDDPEVWRERFHSPTWTDYLHRISRKLSGDDPLYRRVLELCSTEPLYHRRLERPAGSVPLGVKPPPERNSS